MEITLQNIKGIMLQIQFGPKKSTLTEVDVTSRLLDAIRVRRS